ncbi:hypothetical protein ALP97_200298 [Pseudomonas salomonii]|uniref:Uncharacterized protein n=1 Tax=Pseudomonas salomonii TaxID=191391 RepID=A0A3M4QB07_9PSED|nr:hypothetical protein ALP97_200298 [Pseudomonas salomonii]
MQLFFGVDQLRLGAGFQAFGLLVLVLAVDTGTEATFAQVEHLAGALEVVIGQVTHDMRLAQIAVSLGHVGSQGQACGLLVDFGGTRLAQRGFPGGALATPEVEVVVEAGADVAHGGIGVALPARVLVLGQARTAHTGAGIQGGHAFGVGSIGRGFGLVGTGAGVLHVGAVLQGFMDQAIELRVAKAFPPVGGRPGGRGQGHAAQGFAGLQRVGVETLALCVEAAEVGTTGHTHRHQHQAECTRFH